MIAAVTYTLWIPNILLTSQLWQEHLFVPLTVVGLAWFGRALRTRSLRDWTAAGIFLGAAASTRSSVAYFILPAALTCIVTTKPRRHVLAGVGVLLGSFALLTVPYSIFISRSVGQAVFIENIGLYALKRPPPSKWDLRLEDFMKTPTAAPTTQEALRYLRAELAQDRRDFVHERVDLVRLLLKPVGGSLLPTLSAPSQTASRGTEGGGSCPRGRAVHRGGSARTFWDGGLSIAAFRSGPAPLGSAAPRDAGPHLVGRRAFSGSDRTCVDCARLGVSGGELAAPPPRCGSRGRDPVVDRRRLRGTQPGIGGERTRELRSPFVADRSEHVSGVRRKGRRTSGGNETRADAVFRPGGTERDSAG